MKRNWIYWFMVNGFKMEVMIEGTEEEFRAYIETEFPFAKGGRYSGATDADVAHHKALGMPIYLAPTL